MAKKKVDARKYLFALKGRTLHTLGQGKPNTIIKIDGKVVTVGADKASKGTAVQIERVQEAFDRLRKDGRVAVNGKSLGPGSGFIGAVLATLPGAEVDAKPAAVRMPGKKKGKKAKKKPSKKKASKKKPSKKAKKRS